MKWYRWQRNVLYPRTTKRTCTGRRVFLQLEELETRALLSAGSLTAAAATNTLDNATAQTNAIPVSPSASQNSLSGYTPQQLQQAYGIPSTINGQLPGTGQTIAIVDAYNDPNIAKDLAAFDAKYGLPTANLTVVNQNGGSALPANNSSWAVEESLDVEMAHAIAPGAKIVLVEASSSSLSDLLTAVSEASMLGNVVSMSWGASQFASESNYASYFSTPGVTYVASAGDDSAYAGPEWPASSPNVLAVGGTTLNLTNSNTIASETAWSDGGGGISSYETAPSFQSSNGVSSSGRSSPDVAWDANPSTGVSVYDSYFEPGWGYVGGTSVGAPSWAGIIALADQQSIADGHGNLSTAQVESTLYGVYSSSGGANYTAGSQYTTVFNDISSGSNGYSATKGYDLTSGLGSPKVRALIALLADPSSASTSSTGSTAGTTTSSTSSNGSTGGTTSGSPHGPNHGVSHPSPSHPHAVLTGNETAGATAGASASETVVSATNVSLAGSSSNSAGSSAFGFNNLSFLGQVSAAPSNSLTGDTPVSNGSLNAAAPQDPLVFGASGWNGRGLSSRSSSLGVSAEILEQSADELYENLEDVSDSSSEDAIADSEEDWSILDEMAPPLLDGEATVAGDAGGGGVAGDAGGGGDGGE